MTWVWKISETNVKPRKIANLRSRSVNLPEGKQKKLWKVAVWRSPTVFKHDEFPLCEITRGYSLLRFAGVSYGFMFFFGWCYSSQCVLKKKIKTLNLVLIGKYDGIMGYTKEIVVFNKKLYDLTKTCHCSHAISIFLKWVSWYTTEAFDKADKYVHDVHILSAVGRVKLNPMKAGCSIL